VTAPSGFGTFAGDILVGNFGDGTISAFSTTGKFVGQLTDSSGNVLVNPGLWDMVFGGGGGANNDPGSVGTLYFTAGGSAGQPNFPTGGSTTAVFANLVPAAAVAGPDFSLNVSAPSATVTAGGSTTLMISASAVGGFNSQIALTCAAPTGLTCALSPATISPGSSASSSTLTLSAASTPPTGGYPALAALLPGLGLFGILFTTRRKPFTRHRLMGMSILSLLLLSSLFTLGCGSSSNKQAPVASQATTLTVTGTSGAISHSVPVSVTVN
jgi:hypothetical protein